MDTIQLTTSEYNEMKERLSLLKDNHLLEKVNRIIDLMYEDKYGLYLNDFTEDLTEVSISQFFSNEPSLWDNV